MKATVDNYLQFMGINIQGDINGITCYKSSKGGVIWFPRAPPRKPATPMQIQQRAKWRSILDDWLAESPDQKASWMKLAARGSTHIHGLNLYIWWKCSKDDAPIITLQRQTGITVL